MYSLTVSTEFIAQHYLTVPDPGPEGTRHSHRYTVELTLEGPALNEHGYLADIDRIEETLAAFADRYGDRTLNDTDGFGDRNPSIENFARIAVDFFRDRIAASTVDRIRVTIGEDAVARATYAAEW